MSSFYRGQDYQELGVVVALVNDPTEAINGRLEHLRASALDFRNLADYIAQSLLESGGFRPALHRYS